MDEGGSAGASEAPGDDEARWSVLGPLCFLQLPTSPAMSYTVPGEGPVQGQYLVSSGPRLPVRATSQHHAWAPGESDTCLSLDLPGEWHVWGADLRFTLPVRAQECAGVTTRV